MNSLTDWLQNLDPRTVDWQTLGERLGAEPASWPVIAGAIALLLFGRRLYWLALAGLGAALAITLAGHLTQYFGTPTPEGRLILALLAGIAGAVVAIFAQRLVVSAIGFLSGVALGAWITPIFWPEAGLWLLLVVLLTGLFGLLLSGRLFEGLLIVATSASGAWLIIEALPQLGPHRLIVGGLALIVGLIAQTRGKKRKRRLADEDKS